MDKLANILFKVSELKTDVESAEKKIIKLHNKPIEKRINAIQLTLIETETIANECTSKDSITSYTTFMASLLTQIANLKSLLWKKE